MESAFDMNQTYHNEKEVKPKTKQKGKTANPVDQKARYIIPILYLVYVGVFVGALIFLNQE